MNNTEFKELISNDEKYNSMKKKLEFPDWYVSISFGKSVSKNYPQALALAKMAPQYIENEVGGKILHQAVYSDKTDEYLQFIKLYELICQWKSCFVVINGNVVDRKIIGGLNYCYGDKCRSGNPNFCYGASPITDNPFGCHRIQISSYNHPWWSFNYLDTKGIVHVDKESIFKRIVEYSQPYRLCPSFSLETVKKKLNDLPDTIDSQSDDNQERLVDIISPVTNTTSCTTNINLDNTENKTTNNITKESTTCSKKHSGCLSCLLGIIIIISLLKFII